MGDEMRLDRSTGTGHPPPSGEGKGEPDRLDGHTAHADPRVTPGAEGERCRNSLHHHGTAPAPLEAGGRLLDWEAERFHKAAARLGLDRALTCALHCAFRSVEVEIPLERDDGTLEIYTGYAVELAERGATIVAVADISGGIRASDGLDVPDLVDWTSQGRPLVEYPHADTVDGSVLETSCDIIIPAAIEGTLNNDIATRLTARLVVEGANGPTTPQAEAILHHAGIAVVPDLIANAGGVISSYFEWAHNHQSRPMPETEERAKVLDLLERSWGSIAAEDPGSWHASALTTAISRVLAEMRAGGVIPAPRP